MDNSHQFLVEYNASEGRERHGVRTVALKILGIRARIGYKDNRPISFSWKDKSHSALH